MAALRRTADERSQSAQFPLSPIVFRSVSMRASASYEAVESTHPFPSRPKIVLNTALMQSPAFQGTNKTAKAMKFIEVATAHSLTNRERGAEHHMTIVITSNSLEEAAMWQWRLGNRFGEDREVNLNVKILSSTSTDYVKVNDLLIDLASLPRDQLPHVVVMCCNHVRIDDILKLLDTLHSGGVTLAEAKVTPVVDIMVDEADGNMGMFRNILASQHMSGGARILREVHLITATAFQKTFWDILDEFGITELDGWPLESHDMELILNEHYRSLEDHHFLPLENHTQDPVKFAALVIAQLPKPDLTPRTVYAPSKFNCSSHYEMRDLFLGHGYTVLVHNGQTKSFNTRTCDGSIHTIELAVYRTEHGIQGELRDVLVHWRERNPTTSIAITGQRTIERALTFNTTGFQFTDMILSMYHLKNMAAALQEVGRGHGDKRYVGIFNFHSPTAFKDAVSKRLALLRELAVRSPDKYTPSDFREKTEKERLRALLEEHIFASTDDAQAFVDRLLRPRNGCKRRKGIHLARRKQNDQGFFVQTSKEYGEKGSPLQAEMVPIPGSFQNKQGIAHGFSLLCPNRVRVDASYIDTSDPSTLRWSVRYFKSLDAAVRRDPGVPHVVF